MSPYGTSKLCGEQYLAYFHRVGGPAWVALRYANVYGPRQDPHGEAGVVAIFTRQMLSGEQVVINGDGEQERDFVHVADCARANLLALTTENNGIFNIGAGIGTTINQVYTVINEITGYKKDAVHGPPKLGETEKIYLDATKAREVLGWEPLVSLEEGLKSTVNYFETNESSVERNLP